VKTFVQDLAGQVRGEVRFAELDRVLYSTDASFYQIMPLGVVIPQDEADVVTTVKLTRQAKLPVLARGGGTSVSGQAVGEAVVLDFAKYMHRVLEVNAEQGWAWVEPGVIQDVFKQQLRPQGLFFAPETATSSRATLGGMAANNSAGPRSIIHGKTIDHILECRVVLSDGSVAHFEPVSPEMIQQRAKGSSLESQLYRKIPHLIAQQRTAILERYPQILRRVSGYNLDALLPEFPELSPLPLTDQRFNLTKLLVGSEGSLGIITALKVRLIPVPEKTVLGVVHFAELNQAIDAVNEILELQPSAVELVGHDILAPAARSQAFKDRVGFLQGDPAAVLVVEFQGAGAEARLRDLTRGRVCTPVLDAAGQADVWSVRKAGLGMLMSVRDERKPVAFVEDPAVPVARLPEFVREFQRIIADHGTTAGYYGHASVGCLHIRPALNMKDGGDIQRMRSMLEAISDLTLSFGGAMSGEHGDGLVRGWLNQKMFGDALYGAFQEIKQAFDFENRMNPGKVVDCPPPDQSLRYGPDYQTQTMETTFDFRRELGLARAVEMCNGNGNCRKQDGTMCPSFQATLEEKHSTRGRANALRAVLAGQTELTFTSPELYDALDLCLSCKSCQTECPSGVNMAKLKSEFLSHYHAAHGTPLRDRVVGNIALVNRLGSATAPVSNWLMRGVFGNWGKRLLGFAPERDLPEFTRERFSTWFRGHRRRGPMTRGKVVLFQDTYMEYNQPAIGRAATELLERLGYEVVLAKHQCCGRPFISKGLLKEAQALARANVARLTPYAARGIPILGCEPSCILTLRDEYPDLVPQAKDLAQQSFTIDEFLYQLHQAGELDLPFIPQTQAVWMHGHCHQKALVGTKPTLELLRLAYPAQEINSGCCGMAGSFGYEQEHYQLSLKIANQRLFPAIERAGTESLLVADGVSCRQQIAHGTGREAVHLVEALVSALNPVTRDPR